MYDSPQQGSRFTRSQPLLSRTRTASLCLASFLVAFTAAEGLAQQPGTRTGMNAPNPNGGARHIPGVMPDIPLVGVPVPLPVNLDEFVVDFDAAVRLGKAFFWDIQAGSDSMTACASCHYSAGTDIRNKGTLNPGHDGIFSTLASGDGGANYTNSSSDFPFHKLTDPNNAEADVLQSINDVVGTAGVMNRIFDKIVLGQGVEDGSVDTETTFHVGGTHLPQVTGRQAPTVINAIFNHRQFWDGRADFNFNGVNPFGDRDTNAQVLELQANGSLDWVHISVEQASLASQAVGPPGSDVEMAWEGRSFKEMGRKLLSLAPLGEQMVDPTDYHLGGYSASPNRGLLTSSSYAGMIADAFHDKWTAGNGMVDGFSQLEHNFSLYWGLAILCYESELVSDQAPWDLWMAGDKNALTDQEKEGMGRFFSGGAACFGCHFGPEFAGGTVSQINDPIEGNGSGVERMGMANSEQEAALLLSTIPGPTNPHVEGHDVIWHLGFDPRGMLLEIIRPDTNQVLAHGSIPTSSGCTETSLATTLNEGPGFPTGPINPLEPEPPAEFAVALDVLGELLPDGSCALMLEIEGEVVPGAGTPGGDYPVLINGQQVGVLVMPVAGPFAIYDVGYYNIGVRPTTDDFGGGGSVPFGPISIAARLQAGDPTVGHLDLSVPVAVDERIAVNGTFRAQSLRNIALTGPYMHNGSMATLEQVVQFYARGADFFAENIDDLDPEVAGVGSLRNKADKQAALVAFLKNGLLDPRVKLQSGPFSHPSLPIKIGVVGDEQGVLDDGNGEGVLEIFEIPATGMNGGQPLDEFIDRLSADIEVAVGGVDGALPGPATTIEEAGLLGCGPAAFVLDATRVVRVSLTKAPVASVSISYAVSDTTVLDPLVGLPDLVFTTEDWFHPQEIVIIGHQDGVVDGIQTASLVFGSVNSVDPAYAGRTLADIEFTVLDTSAVANTVFVDSFATNEFVNGSEAFPFHSLEEALGCNAPGDPGGGPGQEDLIILGAGVHNAHAVFNGSPVRLISTQGAILQGSGTGPVLTFFGASTSGSSVEGIELRGGAGEAGGVFVTNGAAVTLINCVITGNSGSLAGGVATRNGADVTLVGCRVENNSSLNGPGGIALDGGSGSIGTCVISGNMGGQAGGGISARNAGHLSIQSCLISGNTAPKGGGIYVEGGSLTLHDTRVIFNSSQTTGGGVHVLNSTPVVISGSKVTGNTALIAGSGLWMDGGSLVATQATIASNSGAEIFVKNLTAVSLNSSIVWDEGSGAAIESPSRVPLHGSLDYSILDYDGFDAASGTPLSADPLFVDAAAGNHAVLPGSPAIDAGDPTLPSDPDGTQADMGSHTILGD